MDMRVIDPPLTKFFDPARTLSGEPRARVHFDRLRTLWVNTGTLCNITCQNCYIESSPTNDRFVYFTRDDFAPFLDEVNALTDGPIEIGFTGGEPFLNPQIIDLIEMALARGHRALILTNAMRPMMRPAVQDGLLKLQRTYPDQFSLRVSLDHHDAAIHDVERGKGSYAEALKGLDWLAKEGFAISLAGRSVYAAAEAEMRAGYARLIEARSWPVDAYSPEGLVLFPEMDETTEVPEISERCWGILNVEPTAMMCASTRMIGKRKDATESSVIACTLLPYDPQFDLARTLSEALTPVSLNNRNCAKFCVLGGGKCSA